MHLGMSGSFRVCAGRQASRDARRLLPRAREAAAHDHVVFHMSTGAHRHLQRSAPLRLHEARRRATSSTSSRCCARSGPSRSATNSMPPCWRAPASGKKTVAQGGALRSESRRRARQHLCLRGAAPRAAVAQAPASTIASESRRAERARRSAGRGDQGGAAGRHRGRRLVAARPQADQRRARRFPAQFPRLRPRGRALPDPRLQRHDPAHRADRPLHLLLPGVPEVTSSVPRS